MRWLSYIIPQIVARRSTRYNPHILVVLENGEYKVLVNGSRESGSYIRDLWRYAIEHLSFTTNPSVKNILVLGVAGGTVIHMLADMFPAAAITGVDIDPLMLDIGKQYFGLDKMQKLTLIASDAKKFVTKQKKSSWDLVILDLFIGREIPEFASSKIFLQAIAKSLKPRGRLFINFLREKEYEQKAQTLVSRLSTVFSSVRSVDRNNNRFFLAQ